jgi:hypothetical protein
MTRATVEQAKLIASVWSHKGEFAMGFAGSDRLACDRVHWRIIDRGWAEDTGERKSPINPLVPGVLHIWKINQAGLNALADFLTAEGSVTP